MNEVIKMLEKGGLTVFILKTEGEDDFWCWEVYTADVEDYDGSPEQFANDIENAMIGTSWGGFDTVEDAVADIGEGWIEKE